MTARSESSEDWSPYGLESALCLRNLRDARQAEESCSLRSSCSPTKVFSLGKEKRRERADPGISERCFAKKGPLEG